MELTEGSAAESVPHATPGMVLRWVQHTDGPRQTVRQNEPEAFFALITKQERPVTLGFEHPWQVRKSLFDLLVFVSFFLCLKWKFRVSQQVGEGAEGYWCAKTLLSPLHLCHFPFCLSSSNGCHDD